MTPTWENQLAEARKLPDSDLQRHASASIDNRCTCQSCFCCACVAVKRERRAALIAAAPDLLAVAKALHSLGAESEGSHFWEDYQALCDQATAAIAKAEGR